jgi:hypothetical protein
MKRHLTKLLVVLSLIAALFPTRSQAQNFISTYAGNGTIGFQNGDTLSATFSQPSDIDRDPFGNLIIVDLTNMIRKISPTGIVTTLAGTGVAGYLDGPGATAKINGALNACIDSLGNVYVSDFTNQRIRKIDVNGNVTTIAGNGVAGYKDTTALEASFRYPRGICMDRQGNLYIADSWNHRIRKMDPNGNVTTFAGGGTSVGVQSTGGYVDGPDTTARFWTPCGLEIDSAGNLFLADAYNHRIRKITPQGIVSTVAGTGLGGANNGGYFDGPAASARFNTPTGLGIDAQGDVYVADTYNNCLRYISGGMVTTAAGSTTAGYQDGNSPVALFNHPRSALVDAAGTHCFIPDGNNHVIRKMTLGLTVDIQDAAPKVAILFPNPAKETVEITFPEGKFGPAEILLSDLNGKIVLKQNVAATGSIVDIRSLSPGIYIVQLRAENQIQQLKLIKE